MNFYNPYFSSAASTSTSFLSKINIKSILAGCTKTLNFVNQSLPIVRQINPVYQNAKTMYKLFNEFKKSDDESPVEKNNDNTIPEMHEEPILEKLPRREPHYPTKVDNTPTFFA